MQFRQKENKPKKLILPIFIGSIMILSVIGFSLTYNSGSGPATDSTYAYNGYTYTRTQAGWIVDTGNGKAQFQYNPRELESISLPVFNPGNGKIYLAYDPDNADQNIDLITQKLNNIMQYLGIRPVKACIKDSINCPNIPIVNCNQKEKVIIIMKQDTLDISTEDNCLYMKGSTLDLDKATDKLAMKLLGLI